LINSIYKLKVTRGNNPKPKGSPYTPAEKPGNSQAENIKMAALEQKQLLQ
jgi:hypothetical protein